VYEWYAPGHAVTMTHGTASMTKGPGVTGWTASARTSVPTGCEDVIRRADITSMRVTSLSAMPADLDRQITIDQMADLLRFLRTSEAK